ncbi:hypothetical protein [Sneathiella sp.]|uniref:hypothetical protein n=1 Tax=Sneathiella sp. TaxID=1964365 RepID=UPI002FE0EF47
MRREQNDEGIAAEVIYDVTARIVLSADFFTAGESALHHLAAILVAEYETPVKVLQLHFEDVSRGDHLGPCADRSALARVYNILLEAPYFSVAEVTGAVEGDAAGIVLACDWRSLSAGGSLSFDGLETADSCIPPRLAELAGGFAALDLLLRRHSFGREEAIGYGLAEERGEELLDLIREHAKKRGKSSIRIMRGAVRGAAKGDQSVVRLVASLAAVGEKA